LLIASDERDAVVHREAVHFRRIDDSHDDAVVADDAERHGIGKSLPVNAWTVDCRIVHRHHREVALAVAVSNVDVTGGRSEKQALPDPQADIVQRECERAPRVRSSCALVEDPGSRGSSPGNPVATTGAD
jgi:hypothetical protein